MIETLIEEVFLNQLMMILIAICLLCSGFPIFMAETSDVLIKDRKIGTLLLIACMVVATYAVVILPL